MSRIFKNSICFLLLALFIFGALSPPKYASGAESAIKPVLDDYTITEEIATLIAEFFVQDYENHFKEANGIVTNSAITDPFAHARNVYGGSFCIMAFHKKTCLRKLQHIIISLYN